MPWPLTLKLYLQPYMFMAFVAFLLKKDVAGDACWTADTACVEYRIVAHVPDGRMCPMCPKPIACNPLGDTIRKAAVCAANVVAYLLVDCEQPALLHAAKIWRDKLLVLGLQAKCIGKGNPKPSVQQLQERGAWLPYEDLFKVDCVRYRNLHPAVRIPHTPRQWSQVTECLVEDGRQAVRRTQQAPEDAVMLFGSDTLENRMRDMVVDDANARHMHDAALAAVTCGYLPPMRPSVVFSLKHPAYALHGCGREDCDVQGCRGNRWVSDTFGMRYS